MYNIENIIENNRRLLTEIITKVREGKLDELDDEKQFYAQVVLKNGFMKEDGTITQEGIEALYE